ncbi:MAG TPA: MBL fold metallo-hydrolase [Candidatus Omnitrophica bacterium]|nr:MBL fold metallo-hydrolase [Candidatus Omnitrophota bacterium]
MILESLIVGFIETNCYIIGCERTLKGVIIDPGGDGEKIVELVKKRNLKIEYIINTHAHIDHIQANEYLKDVFNVPICIHREGEEIFKDPVSNLSSLLLSRALVFPSPERLLDDGEEIKTGYLTLSIFHTPGHTPDSISVVVEKAVFTGDALFAGGIGRTDLPSGDYNLLIQSIRNKILSLPDEYAVYPGHGPSSTVGIERGENPYV